MTVTRKQPLILLSFPVVILSAALLSLIPSSPGSSVLAGDEASSPQAEFTRVAAQGLPPVPALCNCLGDMNNDFLLNGKDIQQFVQCLLGPSLTAAPCFCADMDSDGHMTLADIPPFVAVLLSGGGCVASATGACCLPANSCINTTLQICTNQAGVFEGLNTICGPGICTVTGACCAPSGVCTQTVPTACSAPSVYHGDGSNCGTVVCTPTGACCPPSGVCFQSPAANCISPQVYFGDGTTCAGVVCMPTGACCLSDGTCVQTVAAACSSPSVYNGDGSECALVTCVPLGGCCKPDNTCAVMTEAACNGLTGIYLGDGTTCLGAVCPPPNPCPALPVPPNPLAAGPNMVGRLNDFNFINLVGTGGGALYPGIPASILEQDGLESSGFFTIGGQDGVPGYDISGRIMYPATANGVNQPVAAGGPFPIVIIAHGNHTRLADAVGGDPSGENFAGYSDLAGTYLQEQLAMRGFISYSIDLDDFTDLFPGILSRAWMVLCNTALMRDLNGLATFAGNPNPLQGAINIDNITLIGHSRGGEAVVQAVRMNAAGVVPGVGPGGASGGFNIRAVWGIASTRFFDGVANYDVSFGAADPLKPVVASSVFTNALPFMGMWGDADGDVNGNDGNQSLAAHVEGTYDGSVPGPKQFVWIYGANHNFWNRSWFGAGFGDDGQLGGVDRVAVRITAANQQDLARAYGIAFVESYIHANAAYRNYFQFAANQVPPVAIAGTSVHLQYQPIAANRRVVDNFETNCDVGTTSNGTAGVNTATLTTPVEGLLIGAVNHAAPPNDPPPCAAAVSTQSWFHLTRGILFSWTANTNHYDTLLPIGQRDVSGFNALSFRVSQDRRDPNVAMTTFIDVQLTDNAGRTSIVRTNTITTIPGPQTRTDNALLTKSMLKTVRLPLCQFKNNKPALNLANITKISFILSQRAAGRLGLDDIEFVNN